jgi:hypothetical protein
MGKALALRLRLGTGSWALALALALDLWALEIRAPRQPASRPAIIWSLVL